MSHDEEWKEKKNPEEEREKSKVSFELNDLKDELMFELDDLHDDLKDLIDDFKDEADDIKDDLRDELEDLMEEREELLEEVGNVKEELDQYGADAREHVENAKEKLERLKRKIENHEAKFENKVWKKVEKAKKKAARINISVDPEMSDEWRGWAEGLGASVSELIRKSMKFVKNNIGDIAKLEQLGGKLEAMGEGIEQAVKDSGIEELGEQIERNFEGKFEKHFDKKKGKPKYQATIIIDSDKKEKIKKRVTGLIKLHNSIPIDKLAQAIDKSDEDAENMVYEMVADGIEGTLEEGVFKYTSTLEEVIAKLHELIDKMK